MTRSQKVLYEMSLASTKLAVDNDLSGLDKALKEVNLRKAVEAPSFADLPKEQFSGNTKNKLWKDLAIHRWLNENNYKLLVTKNYKHFISFQKRNYGILGISDKQDFSKLASKIKQTFTKASDLGLLNSNSVVMLPDKLGEENES